MQFPAEWAEFFNQCFFDEVMHIFGASANLLKPRGIVLGALRNLVKSSECLLYFGGGENANGFEGLGPSAVHSDFIRQQPPVERKRTLERVEPSFRLTLEAPSP